jgi:Nucleoside-diphosphate-sugar epimerases
MFNKSSKILITGGSGFVGANIVRHLINERRNVVVGVRGTSNLWRLNGFLSSIIVEEINLLDPIFLKRKISEIKPDIVINCAAYGVNSSRMDPELAFKINVQGTNSLFEICAQTMVKRFVHIGTAFEYGSYEGLIAEDLL